MAALDSPGGQRLKLLFLCTGNSCRSQMAEGWTRELKSDLIDAYSAGVETHGLNPLAVRAMREAGVNIGHHHSKHLHELRDVPFDFVVTVCDNARETCPIFPGGTKQVHRSFDDPPHVARDAKDEIEAMAHYRRVRDEIRAFVESLPEGLEVKTEIPEPEMPDPADDPALELAADPEATDEAGVGDAPPADPKDWIEG